LQFSNNPNALTCGGYGTNDRLRRTPTRFWEDRIKPKRTALLAEQLMLKDGISNDMYGEKMIATSGTSPRPPDLEFNAPLTFL
jgi:hypothetical protein